MVDGICPRSILAHLLNQEDEQDLDIPEDVDNDQIWQCIIQVGWLH